MASNVRVKMNRKGSAEILKSPEIQADLKRRVDAVAARAGAGFEAEVKVGRTRALGIVKATTLEAATAEAENRTLTKALDAAR